MVGSAVGLADVGMELLVGATMELAGTGAGLVAGTGARLVDAAGTRLIDVGIGLGTGAGMEIVALGMALNAAGVCAELGDGGGPRGLVGIGVE